MGLSSTGQDDYSAGAWKGKKAPSNAFFGGVNLLINDEGLPFRRGGSAYKSAANAGSDLDGLWDGYLAGGQRTVFWSEAGEDVYTLDSNDSTVVAVSTSDYVPRKLSRGAVVGGVLFLPGVESGGSASLRPIAYGGSRKTSDPANFTGTFTNGSRTMTAAATSFLTTADAGMILVGAGGVLIGGTAAVARVISDTSLELVDPWAGATGSGTTQITRISYQAQAIDTNATDPVYVTSAGQRLIMAQGSKVYFTPRGEPFGSDSYHQLPGGAIATGADSLNDMAIIFTTAGVWRIGNLALDAIDAYGNIQHTVQQISKDVILWGDSGIAAWDDALVVPAVDDVYVFDSNGQKRCISEGIRPVYRALVKNCQPGLAAVHDGHYFLPVVISGVLSTVLVCRLDRPTRTGSGRTVWPWTDWTGHAMNSAYAERVGSTTRSPKLLGISGQRVLDLTATLTPTSSNPTDADGTTADAVLTTRDYPTGANQPGFVKTVRGRYELVDPYVDDFEATADGTLGSPWLAWIGPMPDVASGEVVQPSGNFGDASRPESVGPDSFCQATVPSVVPAQISLNFGVGIRLTAHSSAANGYMFEISDAGTGHRPRLYRGAAFTTVATGTTITGGTIQAIKITAVGTTITGWVKVAGAWVSAVTATDATYSAAGYPGFWVQKTSGSDFGVDEVAWGPGTAPPAVTPAFSSDADAGAFTTLTSRSEQAGLEGWDRSDGSKYQWASVNKKREKIRFRFTVTGPSASFVWRALEMLTRPSGKQ